MKNSFLFLGSLANISESFSANESEKSLDALIEKMRQLLPPADFETFDNIIQHSKVRKLLRFILYHSPFLTQLIRLQPVFFIDCCRFGPEQTFDSLRDNFNNTLHTSVTELMRDIRITKGKASLLIGVADITGLWELDIVTRAMSNIADDCVEKTLSYLLTQASRKNEVKLKDINKPTSGSGVFILGMGKLGARELNYSSDIDIIVFFDKTEVSYTGDNDSQHFYAKITREMVRILQERTADGYGFRVDLRLRPDPSSTPVAMSTAGAITYYETVGQNWERAALIKARVIAGDKVAGTLFLKQLSPFIWRKYLDFATIEDILSIKRQMDSRNNPSISLPGHNIKTGLGGIREIEFFAQIHQLIWGGRIPELRLSGTCETLRLLASVELITQELADRLIDSYVFLRTTEHRLQMKEDQQTHSIPNSDHDQSQLATFMYFDDLVSFSEHLLAHLHFVHENFTSSFKGTGSLADDKGKLSFTGVENDPQTLATIERMGFINAASISAIIQAWHRGSRRATRTKRARELITELTPSLLKSLAATSNPDQAFMHFDDFLAKLPAGVQLFSLFAANPHLLDLIVSIMGSAPALAESLSKNPNLLDTVLTSDFTHALADKDTLVTELKAALSLARDYEDEIDIIHRFKSEKQFLTGVHLIRYHVGIEATGNYFSDLADVCIEELLAKLEKNFIQKNPDYEPGTLAIVALGRLGAKELTFGSDIDLVFVYNNSDQSTLTKCNPVTLNKFSQHVIGALTALTREGRLYEVDTRLRPSGKDGVLAVSVDALKKYLDESAWVFESMAFVRARVITGDVQLRSTISGVILNHIMSKHNPQKLVSELIELREKITKEFGSNDPWNLKYVHGGLMDINFIAQYYVLRYAHQYPDIINGSSEKVFDKLILHTVIDETTGKQLIEAHRLLNCTFMLLRLCGNGKLDEQTATNGLKHFITRSLGLDTFEGLKQQLLTTLERTYNLMNIILNPSQIK